MALPPRARQRRPAAETTTATEPLAGPVIPASWTYGEVSGDAVLASAAMVPLENLGWDRPRQSAPWQRELWRLIDIVGELKYSAGWVASHFSRAVLRMHDVGDDGEIGGETSNAKARAIAASILGRPDERREVMRLIGFILWLVGEVYLGVLAGKGPHGRDRWFAVGADDLQRAPDGGLLVDLGEGKERISPGQDVLQRCWTPDPHRVAAADSSAKSTRIILRELEKLTLFIFAQIDSRLTSAGILVVPAGMSTVDGEVTAQDLMRSLVKTAAESLKGEGTAAGVVPLVLEVPIDAVDKVQLVQMASELSDKALKLREEAAGRLANNLDIPAEEISGGMGDTNHWSSYQIGPDAIKKHIEPLLARLCHALQRGWVDAALTKVGLDPEKFQIWYDTTPLIVRPQRFQEALELWKSGLISNRAMLDAAGFYNQDAPEDRDDVKRYLRELVLRDPQMFNQASVRALVGITEDMIPASVGQPDITTAPGQSNELITDSKTPPPPPPAPETVPKRPVTGRPPVSRNRQPAGVAASAAVLDPTPLALLVVADAVSLRALELAGGRLLTHQTRGQLRDVPRHEIHTRVPVDIATSDMNKLLAGWSELLPTLASAIGMPDGQVDSLTGALRRYCESTLTSGEPHNRSRMITYLRIAGVLDVD